MNWTSDIEVVVLDMDGTLYQDQTFMRRYLSYLLEGTDRHADESELYEQVERILGGSHACKIGYFYDPLHRLILRHRQGEVIAAISLEGGDADEEKRIGLYGANKRDMSDCMYIGDGWGTIGFMAHYLGIEPAKRTEAFLRVREEMVSDKLGFTRHIALLTAVKRLKSKGYRTLLMTNSPERSSREFVAYMGMEGEFDEVLFNASKPTGLLNRLQRMIEEEGVRPETVVSVGDHAWNDLYPVKKLGGRTIWISPYDSYDEERWDARMSDPDELADFLDRLPDKSLFINSNSNSNKGASI
ncbi:HAD family hydrolase [Cohnella lupini]|uniref:FMN phosphatase YigB (HAD superfamily) n=1 Tax=Cohnella lupini TaxID=1294267 RepID=A0A3D9I9S6_9BACL|nr:HAD family hydrolase [Cohnella lupini]RED58533.1 FMN phosphatase YigB (HAD superfamily) [Cohnella lupini]